MWGHVISEQNPADFISRGHLPADFIHNNLWKFGPDWLLLPEEQWPKQSFKSSELPERKKNVTLLIKNDDKEFNLLDKFSSLKKLIRVTAYCLRVADKAQKRDQFVGPLTTIELDRALKRIITLVQGEEFSEEIRAVSRNEEVPKKSKLLRLNPIWDDRLLRVGGRIKESELAYQQQHPILLPKKHPFTDLVIRDCHESNMHSGINATLYAVRANYWPVDGRSEVRRIISGCVKCFRVRPKETSYVMGNLPRSRVTAARPFENSGVDYCGPFFVKEKRLRNRGRVKVYAAVFVCLSTKAVHVELIGDLSTELFLAGLRRFFARRGKCRALFSDNGTNFVGAKNDLKEIYSLLNEINRNEVVQKNLADQNIEWHFNPPRTPHFGGIWEAAVKSLKNHLRRTIGETLFTYEELYTYMCEVEGILNSRPLTPISTDPNDLQVLTPGHFLIGEPVTTIPSLDYSQVPSNKLSSWQHIQKIKRDFWKRWACEYLNELNVRAKWCTGSSELIKEGMLVVLRDENLPPLRWSLGRIVKAQPGDDGIIRVVQVKTKNGVTCRGVKKVSPLPIDVKLN